MRVLHLDAGKEMRGGQWQVVSLLEGLAAAGVESTLLARRDSPLFATAAQRGWCVEPLGPMRAALLARRHDLVHAHDARGHTVGAVAGGAPLVVSRRVAFPIRSRWKYERADRYLAVSEFVKRVLIEGGVPQSKVHVVPDGVPLLPEACGDAVVAPATDDPQKGSALVRQLDTPVVFSQDLQRDLLHAAILVYVTHSEGLGSGALLAMSAGVPVIASRVGGLPEIVRHRETGLLVDNTPEAIAAALRELRADPEFGRRLGAAGRRMVAEGFTVDHMVRRTMEVYKQVLS